MLNTFEEVRDAVSRRLPILAGIGEWVIDKGEDGCEISYIFYATQQQFIIGKGKTWEAALVAADKNQC